MKKELSDFVALSLKEIQEINNIEDLVSKIEVSETKNKAHGDYSTNIALILSKELKKPPLEIAQLIINASSAVSWLKKSEVAGPGFINFFISPDSHLEIISKILNKKEKFGNIQSTKNSPKVLIEYVSSNPTGPLHVGHGRGAAFGSSIAKLLKSTGFIVEEEYYVNDYGRQMDILTSSVFIRYLESYDPKVNLPNNCYQGAYIKDISQGLDKPLVSPFKSEPDVYASNKIYKSINNCKNDKGLDNLILLMKSLKSDKDLYPNFHDIKKASLDYILNSIKVDLHSFGVKHNNWFFESNLYKPNNNSVDLVIKELKEKGMTYDDKGATWFKSTNFGDDKDRVIVRENKEKTYFASDIAYHLNKYNRGFDRIINIWGSDHHGYLPRVTSAMAALNKDQDKLQIIFVQFANLVRNNKKVSMSTRGGDFVSLKELIEEVSADAARFFYIMRKSDQHLDFDLDLAKEQSKDNPLFYIQYAHARICSILKDSSSEFNLTKSLKEHNYLTLLKSPLEIELSKLLNLYPEIIRNASNKFEPHLICYFLKDLASKFHSYYNSERILIENKELQSARLLLIAAIKQVISNGLDIIGVSAPESM